ncbi:MAG: outer membrane beta-barrel domain-containing protein [Myxococcales bacterium]|nr:outer membrane beta-barrel domain-containing protein [Myxococcales bacterium]
MSVRNVFQVSALSLVMLASSAWAQSAEDEAELVEKVAVRNRLFNVEKRWEVGGNVGFTLLPRLTDHYNLNVSVGYNVAEWLGLELRAGYAISRQTSLADQVKQAFLTQMNLPRINDFSDLWQMTANGVVGVRFQPIYGKLNLLAELPVHFQLYFWAGGGAGLFNRESLLICLQRTGSGCGQYFNETKVSPIVSLALGFRFFIAEKHAVRLEARTWSFLDSYFVNVDRANVSAANPTAGGMESRDAGITTISQIDLGYSFVF